MKNFQLSYTQGHWSIRRGSQVKDDAFELTMTGILIDGSGRREKYPDGIICSRELRAQQAGEAYHALEAYSQQLRFVLPTGLTLVYSREEHDPFSATEEANKVVLALGLDTGQYMWEVMGNGTYRFDMVCPD